MAVKAVKSTALAPSGNFFFQAVRALAGAAQTAKERRALSELTDEQLRDIGVSREEAKAEAERPFWDAPKAR